VVMISWFSYGTLKIITHDIGKQIPDHPQYAFS
jgi:hypothetical protein